MPVQKVSRFSLLSLMAFALLLTGSNSWANPNVLGTFSGSLTGLADLCLGSGFATTNNVTMNITSQSGSSFSGTFTVSGISGTGNVSGSVDAVGNMSGTFSGANLIGFGFSGFFDGSTLSIGAGNFSVEDLSMNCFDIGGSLSFTGGDIIDPSIAPGTSIITTAAIQTQILGVIDPIETHLIKTLNGEAKGTRIDQSGFTIEGEGGLNAGNWQLGNLGVWLSYNYRDSENDFIRTAYESTYHTAVGGFDYSPNERLVLGVAFAYENGDTDTTFNAGNLESDGYTIAPYIGYLLNDTWSIDASFGYTYVENEQFRTDATGVTPVRVFSDPDTDRYFMNLNFNGITYHNNWVISGRAGILFAKSVTDTFTESNGSVIGKRRTKLGQARIGGDVAYSFGEWEPYFGALYEYDFKFDKITLTPGLQPANDRNDVLLSTGFRYFNKHGLSMNMDYSKRVLREDFDDDSLSLTVRYDY